MITRTDLLGAAARGYCTEENSKKTLDSVLLKAIVEEIVKTLKANGYDVSMGIKEEG